MDIPRKIKMAEAYAGISEAELSRRLNTTAQAFGQRMKTGRFTSADLDKIAAAMGAEFICCFRVPDGTEV